MSGEPSTVSKDRARAQASLRLGVSDSGIVIQGERLLRGDVLAFWRRVYYIDHSPLGPS